MYDHLHGSGWLSRKLILELRYVILIKNFDMTPQTLMFDNFIVQQLCWDPEILRKRFSLRIALLVFSEVNFILLVWATFVKLFQF